MKKKILLAVVAIVSVLLFLPQSVTNPVEGCGPASYNHKTFWHPWGDHHHHGVDIFALSGTPIRSAVPIGIVIATTSESQFGKRNLGGNTVTVLGTHGRIYYYAHMNEVKAHVGEIVTSNTVLGTVGNTGNARNTPSHCHFSIMSIIPNPDHWVPSEQRTKRDDAYKIFFVNPVEVL